MSSESLHDWLMSERPASRRQAARCGPTQIRHGTVAVAPAATVTLWLCCVIAGAAGAQTGVSGPPLKVVWLQGNPIQARLDAAEIRSV